MHSSFSSLDWFVFALYFVLLLVSSILLSRTKIQTSRDFFVGSNSMGMLFVAISVVATSQSAATFLGAPEYSYRGDLTYIGFYISSFLAVLFISYVLIPRFYAIKAMTVYELLTNRYGQGASQYAGIMFLVGRLFASGARLYIAALAVSMIIFSDIAALHVAISILTLMIAALAYTYFGGVKSVILSDTIQAVTYVSAGVAVLYFLYSSLGLDMQTILSKLANEQKLKLFDLSLDGSFNLLSLLTGWFLLNVAAYGLDQDMAQRLLSCKDEKEAKRSLIYSILFTVPVVVLFLAIGLLLYLFYQDATLSQSFQGESVTIFMYYILNEMPSGLRGFITVGAIAAALSSTNSVLGAMSSVAVEDIYRPFVEKRVRSYSNYHFVRVGRLMIVIFAILLSLMALLSYYWQQYTNLPLLSFALGVMAFSYSGLLGVYISALFTKRGSQKSVLFALIGGFLMVLLLQPYIFGFNLGFAWQIVIGTLVSFVIMQSSKQ